MSTSSASPIRVSARSPAKRGTNDCSDLKVREAVTAELSALPFLGALACSTSAVVAGSTEELIFTYTVGLSGIADSGWLKLCFRFYSDWDLQTTDPQARDFASARLLTRSLVGGASESAAATAQQLKIRYDVKGGERPFQKALLIHVVDGYLRPGDTIEIRLGDRRFGGPGTRVQTFVEDEFEFHLFVDPLGTSRMARAALSRLAIVPGAPKHLAVLGPRLVRSDYRTADLRVHLQDRWGNACRDITAAVQARVDESVVASSVFPVEGWAAVTITVPAEHHCVDVVAQVESGAIGGERCYLDRIDDFPSPRALFADLHVHSNDTVGTQDTPSNLTYGRDVGALDVIGYTANDFQITDDVWADVVEACRDINEDGRLVCYPGEEWCGTAGDGGDHNVVFLGEDTTLARSLEWHVGMASATPIPQTWPITQLYAAYDKDPDSYLLIPHVGGRRAILDWHHPQLERLIEVHSAWGTNPWFFEDAMTRGLRLGASAASDEHRGRPGGGAPGANIFGGHGGLTGVLAPELSRDDVGRSLRARRTWATTGARAVALLRSGDQWMGDEIDSPATELAADYALYGTTGWEELQVWDAGGLLYRRDFHSEIGLSDTLVRIRWGGARHKDRYRWATWAGRLTVAGSSVDSVTPWAATHPEQVVKYDGNDIVWRTQTFGSEIGVIVRLSDLAEARLRLETTIEEDGLRADLAVTGAELLSTGTREVAVGGLNLTLRVERVADLAALPITVSGKLTIDLPPADSAVYLRARQSDGHQVWTSPLFINRPRPE